MTQLFDKKPKPDYSARPTAFSIIQVMKLVAPDVPPRPYRLVETYVTSEGMRTRVCSGAFETQGEAEFHRETLEKIVAGGGQK